MKDSRILLVIEGSMVNAVNNYCNKNRNHVQECCSSTTKYVYVSGPCLRPEA